MKVTTIIISQSPLKSVRVSEALRMGVGLTLCNDAVQVMFVGDGVYTLLQTEPGRIGMPEYFRHLQTLRQMGHRIFTEQEALEERGISRLAFQAEIVPRPEVARLLLASDFVIRY